MAKYISLYSSSTGNSGFLTAKGSGLLIDAGVSCKRILQALAENNIDCSCVKGMVITHEHSDHIKGLPILLKKLKIPVYGTDMTLQYLLNNLSLPVDAKLIPIDKPTEIASMQVTPFSIPHDCADGCGYKIETSDNKVFAVSTDLGYVTEEVKSNMLKADAVVIESNYDIDMLKVSSYPYMLKQRISGKEGHLSNKDCAMLCAELVRNKTTRIVLAHLSRENNTPTLARDTTLSALSENGMRDGIDLNLHIAPADFPSASVIF